ncbi:MAG: hypothetical protein C0407_01730 [Desulfobacca sp.]|nr:hypothetical protein [Desulfobacca sp.]
MKRLYKTGKNDNRPHGALLFFIVVSFLILLAAMAGRCWALEKNSKVAQGEFLSLGVITQYTFSSHTSYEFGNPLPPYQSRLSRLEFPLNSWWAGAELKVRFPRFSFGLKALTNVSQEALGRMRDSDWDNEANPNQKTIYSESNCRLDPSYFIEFDGDLKVSDWLHLPSNLDLRPVIGYRWQKFNFVTHDGSQLTLGEQPIPLSGNTLYFEQTYKQIFLGLRANLDLGKWGCLGRLTTMFQIDWAYVEGSNQDQHLLRTGTRFTYEETIGQAWHESIGLKAHLAKHVALTLKADFVQIATDGTHRLVNAPLGIDLKFSNGVKAWSDQNSLSLMLEYAFY